MEERDNKTFDELATVMTNISNQSRNIDADISLVTNEKELIPESTLIIVYLDEQRHP